MAGLHLIEHPLIQHKISLLRDKNTGVKEFRELTSETAMLICYEATRDLPLKEVDIATPVAVAKTKIISGRKLAFVPIPSERVLVCLSALQILFRLQKVGHIVIFRNDEHNAVQYYCKLPDDISERDVIIVDPMLATGNTAVYAIDELKKSRSKNIKFMCIIASPEGIERLTAAHPDVDMYCGVKDQGLNENKYIVPGMGDAGDRIFGTK